MGHAFASCTNLESINFGPNFKTNNGAYFDGMFRGCQKSITLD